MCFVIINWRKSISEFDSLVLIVFLTALDIYRGLGTSGRPTDNNRSAVSFEFIFIDFREKVYLKIKIFFVC